MPLDANLHSPAHEAELQVVYVATLVLAAFALRALFRQIAEIPRPPDPWGDEISNQIEGKDAAPLCLHCLTPHTVLDHFCSECGAPAGDCTTYMPYLNILAIGHVARIGTAGEFQRSPMNLAWFLFFGIAEYSVFAPFYWYRLFKPLRGRPQTDLSPRQDSDEPG